MTEAESRTRYRGGEAPFYRRGLSAAADVLANPMAMIVMALLAVALWATPHYLRAMEREVLEGELWLTICGGLAPGSRDRSEIRRPLI
jgi:hypothetical protein